MLLLVGGGHVDGGRVDSSYVDECYVDGGHVDGDHVMSMVCTALEGHDGVHDLCCGRGPC